VLAALTIGGYSKHQTAASSETNNQEHIKPKSLTKSEMTMHPNIVLIVADDLGTGDPGCYDPESKVPTPNIDSLARDGLKFTNAYCPDAICTPSRYSMLTGRYSWRTGRAHGGMLNWEPPMIAKDQLTLPQVLQRAGYVTGGFGKWHLGADFPTTDGKPPVGQFSQRHPEDGINLDLGKPLAGGPLDRGFDKWYGFICSSESLVYDGAFAAATIDVYPHPKAAGVDALQHFKLEDYLPEVTHRAISFVGQQADRSAGHKPFFLYYAPYVPHVPLAVPKEFEGKTRGGPYGDYVAALDHYIGLLLQSLDDRGLRDNTLVFFSSDNGSQFITTGEGHRPNGHLNGTKAQILEGGVRTPLIVRWPGVVAPGTSTDRLAALTDLMATVAAVTEQSLPENAAEDSFNLLPLLRGEKETQSVRGELVVKAATAQLALRHGPWKYIPEPGFALSGGPAQEPMPPRLFNLKDDPGETTDLISGHPGIAAEMRSRLEALVRSPRSAPQVVRKNP
jgi:arylsulfatase A-like enzyme